MNSLIKTAALAKKMIHDDVKTPLISNWWYEQRPKSSHESGAEALIKKVRL